MFIVSVDEERCDGCNSCIAGCPSHILGFNGKVFIKGNAAECMGCQSCVLVCACRAITVMEI